MGRNSKITVASSESKKNLRSSDDQGEDDMLRLTKKCKVDIKRLPRASIPDVEDEMSVSPLKVSKQNRVANETIVANKATIADDDDPTKYKRKRSKLDDDEEWSGKGTKQKKNKSISCNKCKKKFNSKAGAATHERIVHKTSKHEPQQETLAIQPIEQLIELDP